MIISQRWLGQYIDLPADNDRLIKVLTFSGIEVEGVTPLPALPETVVTAKVLSAERIPGTDHLHVCQVEYGAGQVTQVVCGAPNCHAGMISVVALPGTELPDLTIKSARLRGVESHGMLCSERELGISDNHAGIIELEPATPVGINANELYQLPDLLLELEITPNRSDLLGYQGIARDLSASLGTPARTPEAAHRQGEASLDIDLNLLLEDPAKCPRYTARLIEGIQVQESPQWLKTALIKSGLRPINNIVDITNYVMLETGHPLHAFDYGKLLPRDPADSYPSIIVRPAKPGEEFLALDGKRYTLDADDLVIADGQRPSALAGVIGGKDTAISDSTRSIVLEAAAFCPTSIRATAYKHKISTDSSYRFERHLSPVHPHLVSDRAVDLILELAGGKVVNGLYDAYPQPAQPQYLGIRPRRFAELIGYPMDDATITKYLSALGCAFVQNGQWREGLLDDTSLLHCHHAEEEKAGITEFSEIDCDHTLYFAIPPQRVDLTREADLLEELARLAGYDRIPQKKAVSRIMDRHAYKIKRSVEDYFVSHGCYETLNYSFSDPAQLAKLAFNPEDVSRKLMSLINPQSSNQSAMRISLLPGLLANLSYNLNHGERNLKLMESDKVYLREGDAYREPRRLTAILTGVVQPEHWKDKEQALTVFHIKGLLEGLWQFLALPEIVTAEARQAWAVGADSQTYLAQGKELGMAGRLRSEIAEAAGIDLTVLKQEIWIIDLDLEQIVEATRELKTEFQVLPRYPSVIRDISFLIDDSIPYSAIQAAILAVDPALIGNVGIFDEYRGKNIPSGKRSISLHLTIQDSEKTLTDERVDQLIASVWKMLERTWNINMR